LGGQLFMYHFVHLTCAFPFVCTLMTTKPNVIIPTNYLIFNARLVDYCTWSWTWHAFVSRLGNVPVKSYYQWQKSF